MRDRLGTFVLEAVRRAKFPFLLRSGQSFYYCWALAGECADIFVAGDRASGVSNIVHHRSCGCFVSWTTFDWRHGVYVRSPSSAADSIAEFVPRDNALCAALGYPSLRLRRARVEVSNAHDLDCRSD